MTQTETTNPQEAPTQKPYHQQPGEPDVWYERFHHFCLLGTARSLRQCYRNITAERHALAASVHPDPGPDDSQDKVAGRPKTYKKQAPGSWKRRAKEFNWDSRATAWDADHRLRSLERLESTLDRICQAADKAFQYQIDLMCGGR